METWCGLGLGIGLGLGVGLGLGLESFCSVVPHITFRFLRAEFPDITHTLLEMKLMQFQRTWELNVTCIDS